MRFRRIHLSVVTVGMLVQPPAYPLAASPVAAQSPAAASAQPVRDSVYQSARHNFRVVTVADGLDHPWSMAWLPSGEMLLTERAGRLRVVREGKLDPEPMAGVPKVYRERGQGGLMDVVLHADFARNRLIYLSYGKPNADGSAGTTTVVRGRLEGHRLVDVEEIFAAKAWDGNNNHFAGRMAFDRSGYLFLTVGDRLATTPLSTIDDSSMVRTSRSTPPRSLRTTSIVASARNGCARRMRSDSARRSSLHRSPTCSSR